MSHLHQIYVTHCTPGSSALRVPVNGYSVRGGSLQGEELRRFHEKIDRFMGYRLPDDTPSELKTKRTAAEAPRRMIFSPEVGELQMVCQVCYRQEDTLGRPGSYFAHALIAPASSTQSILTTRECLRLWGFPQWQIEDPPGDLGVLQSFESLDQWADGQPIIGDELLLQFLTVKNGNAIAAPEEVVPSRLRKLQPSERRTLLSDCLHRYLELTSKSESLLLVAEPGLAALLFYGIARLLPPGPLCDRISFSTYEPRPQRLLTRLAATRFHEPERNDVPPEMYRGTPGAATSRGAVLNTWLQRRTKTQSPQSNYARQAVEFLVDGDWSALDDFHRDLSDAGVAESADLERLAGLDQTLAKSLTSGSTGVPAIPTAVEKKFLQRRVHRRLGDPNLLEQVSQPRSRVFQELLMLLATDPSLEADDPVLQRMQEKLPDKLVSKFIACEEIPRPRRIGIVRQYVMKHHQLPRGRASAAFLPQLMPSLPDETLKQYRENLPYDDVPDFVLQLAEAVRLNQDRQAILPKMVEQLEEPQLLDVLCDKRAGGLLQQLPAATSWPWLQQRLRPVQEMLTSEPQDFTKRFQALVRARKHLPQEGREAIDDWGQFIKAARQFADTSGTDSDHQLLLKSINAVPIPKTQPDQDPRVSRLELVEPLVKTILADHPQLDWVLEELHLAMIGPIIARMSPAEFCTFAQDEQNQAVLAGLPLQEAKLSALLADVLDNLHNSPAEFRERLGILECFRERLPEGHDRLGGWLLARATLKEIEKLALRQVTGRIDPRSIATSSDTKKAKQLGDDLGTALLTAMPTDVVPFSNWDPSRKLQVSKEVAREVLQGSIYDHSIPENSCALTLLGKRQKRAFVPIAILLCGVTALVSGITLFTLLLRPGSDDTTVVVDTKDPSSTGSSQSIPPSPTKKKLEEKQAPKKEVPKKEVPKKEVPKKEVPKKEVPKKEAPKKGAPKKGAPKKAAPKKAAPKKAAPKKDKPTFAMVELPPGPAPAKLEINHLGGGSTPIPSIDYDNIKKLELYTQGIQEKLKAVYNETDKTKELTLGDPAAPSNIIATLRFKKETTKSEALLSLTWSSMDLSTPPRADIAPFIYFTPLKITTKTGPDIYVHLNTSKPSNAGAKTRPPFTSVVSIAGWTPQVIPSQSGYLKHLNGLKPDFYSCEFKDVVKRNGTTSMDHPITTVKKRVWKVAKVGTLELKPPKVGETSNASPKIVLTNNLTDATKTAERLTLAEKKKAAGILQNYLRRIKSLHKIETTEFTLLDQHGLRQNHPFNEQTIRLLKDLVENYKRDILKVGYEANTKDHKAKSRKRWNIGIARVLSLLPPTLHGPRKKDGKPSELPEDHQDYRKGIGYLFQSLRPYIKLLERQARAFKASKTNASDSAFNGLFVRGTLYYAIPIPKGSVFRIPLVEFGNP